jgi:2-iminobutanoate/2-iminopropanoate deaminase
MARDVIQTPDAPKAIGPYSQAISVNAGRMVFLSGQIPLDPSTGELVTGDIQQETERAMKNLEAVLAASGMTFANVVRCGIFLTDLGDFGKVNEVYGRYFPTNPPARATVQVSALPTGARVEVDCIAVG